MARKRSIITTLFRVLIDDSIVYRLLLMPLTTARRLLLLLLSVKNRLGAYL